MYFTTRLLQSFTSEIATRPLDSHNLCLQKRRRHSSRLLVLSRNLKRMQNRLPSSTENSYREEERDSKVFLKACDEPASQLNPDRDKIFNFPENNFLQQISQRSSSSGLFAFGNTAEAAKPPEMHHKKVPCFNPHFLFSVDGNAERPTEHERAASLVRDTQLSIEDDMMHLQRQWSNTWIAHLEGLGNDEEQYCCNSHISLKKLNRITVMDGGAPELL